MNWLQITDAGGQIIGYVCPQCTDKIELECGQNTSIISDADLAAWDYTDPDQSCFRCGNKPEDVTA